MSAKTRNKAKAKKAGPKRKMSKKEKELEKRSRTVRDDMAAALAAREGR